MIIHSRLFAFTDEVSRAIGLGRYAVISAISIILVSKNDTSAENLALYYIVF